MLNVADQKKSQSVKINKIVVKKTTRGLIEEREWAVITIFHLANTSLHQVMNLKKSTYGSTTMFTEVYMCSTTMFTEIYSYLEKGRKKCTRQYRKELWVVLSSVIFKEI